jgi:TolB protein
MSHLDRYSRWILVASLIVPAIALTAAFAAAGPTTQPGKNGRIAFTRYADASRTQGAIFTISIDGTGERRVTRPPVGAVDFQPDWSSDGTLIVFQRCSASGPCEVYTVKPDGTALKRLSGNTGLPSDDSGPSFVPERRRIVFTRASGGVRSHAGGDQIRHSDLVVMDLNGKNRRVISGAPIYQADYENPMFAPRGDRLVYEHRRSYFADRTTRRALFVVSASGQQPKRITPWSMNAGDHPDWSPDGRHILFRAPEDSFAGSSLYVIRPDGTGLRQVTRFGAATEVLSASFSPDGEWLVFSRTGRSGRPDIFVIRRDGSGLRQVTRTSAWDSAPDWGPR